MPRDLTHGALFEKGDKMSKRDFYSFGEMRGKLQHVINENDYFVWMLCADELMFEYDGLPENIDKNRFEDFLNISNGCVWQYKDGVHMIAPNVPRSGELDMYGYGKIVEAETLDGVTLSGEVGKDIAVIYNNTARGAQWDLMTDADIFADIDRSTKINVQFARVAPILQYANDNQKQALQDALKHIVDGEIDTIFSESTFEALAPLGSNENGDLKSVEITDPSKIQYVQYLSQLWDIRLRRHFARRGLSLKTSDKQAQVTKDEVHGLDAVSWFYPLSKLQARKEGLDMVNKIFGTNISVRFSDLWAQEFEAYKLRTQAKDEGAENATEEIEKGVADNVEENQTGNDTP